MSGRGIGEGEGQGQWGLKEKTTHKYNCNGYQKSHHGVSILGEKVFCCWTWRGGRWEIGIGVGIGVSCNIDGVYLSVCLSSTWDDVDVKNKTIKKEEKKITGCRYIFYRSLSTLHTLCLLISYSVIHPFFSYFLFFFPFLLYPQRPTRLLPRVFSLALGRELAYTFLTTHGLVPYLPAIKLSIKLSMYLAGNAKYYKLKQETRSEELRSTMRCFFIIIIIRAF